MNNDPRKNKEGYLDLTAYEAIRKSGGVDKMELFAGDVYEVEMNNGATKEALILSVHDTLCQVLLLTDNESLPCSVVCRGMKYTNPAMVQYLFNSAFTTYIRSLSVSEHDEIMRRVFEELGWVPDEKPANKEMPVATEPQHTDFEELKIHNEDLIRAEAERDIFKGLYEKLLEKVVGGLEK